MKNLHSTMIQLMLCKVYSMCMTKVVQRFLYLVLLLLPNCVYASSAEECVILLHGMVRTSASMGRMEHALKEAGYNVANVNYPSRDLNIQELAPIAIEQGLAGCPDNNDIHFVTHSLGGILLRYYLAHHTMPQLGRVVMLAPPNKGSQVVDRLKDMPLYKAVNGPAGLQLGTDGNSIPAALGPVDFETGVIAGTKTVNPILSRFLPNPDDGKVSVDNTKVDGMSDFITVPHSHPFIMRAPIVIEQTITFIQTGRFSQSP